MPLVTITITCIVAIIFGWLNFTPHHSASTGAFRTSMPFLRSYISRPSTGSAAVKHHVVSIESSVYNSLYRDIISDPLAAIHHTDIKITATMTNTSSDYVSVTVHGTRTSPSESPKLITKGETLDIKNGESIPLKNLLDGSTIGMKMLVKKTGIRPALLRNAAFVALTTKAIGIYTGTTAHPVRVKITKQLAPYMQNHLAGSLFDIPQTSDSTIHTNCLHEKCVALTFDDGPGIYTKKLLKTLAKNHVHATFFLLGPLAQKYSAIVKDEFAGGHAIGNHTWNHYDLPLFSRSEIKKQITRTNAAVKKTTGENPTMLRPPYGATDETLRSITRSLGMSSIFWSVDAADWSDQNSHDVCSEVLHDTEPGSIVLMHDIYSTTVDAIPCIIHGLKKRGYTMVTVPQLMGTMKPGANYYEE